MSQLVIMRPLMYRHRCLLPHVHLQMSRMLSVTNSRWQIRKAKSSENRALQEAGSRTDVSTDVRPLGEKIKENTKTASYTAIIVAGVGVTAIMFWAICRELFSSSSPNNIYSDALKRVKEDPRVQDALGAPIKGFGEESRRGRRQRVAHSSYERNGVQHMRMQFYVQGIRNRATVHLESRKTLSGNREYRYLFVQLDYYPHTTIILEDNRSSDRQPQVLHTPLDREALEFASFKKD